MRWLMLFTCMWSVSACDIGACPGKPIPIAGDYAAESSDQKGWEGGSMKVDGDEVVITYERPNGSRYRATYRVASRGSRLR